MNHDSHRMLALHRYMVISRVLEAACGAANPRWFPAEGEEAAIIGTFYGLRSDDVVAPHYRGPFVVYLMRGAEMARLCAQALGKETGYARGRAVPFTGPIDLGIVPWVAGDLGTSLGIATGAALGFTYEGSDRVSVVSMGDGTANCGDFHENLNLAAAWKLPVVYVVQNNGWAISEPISAYLPAPIAARAAGYGIPGVTVDGNDVIAVHDAVTDAVTRARRGLGPSLIEARTYRLLGHWQTDTASYRAEGEVQAWRDLEPIKRFERLLVASGISDDRTLAGVWRDAEGEVAAAMEIASSAPAPDGHDLGEVDVW
jgi:TPP-dependent pyruvate/acetoin dehydrogenase alpha subunit